MQCLLNSMEEIYNCRHRLQNLMDKLEAWGDRPASGDAETLHREIEKIIRSLDASD